MNMMSLSTVVTWGILLLALLHTSQVIPSLIETCMKEFYLSDGVCKPCPSHCDTCTNATHCTSCQMSYYGQICENECEEGCAGTCHKVYGHCTYGCEDGAYPDVSSLACLDCRKECKVCRSLNSCLVCYPGYHGESCRKTCSGLCKGSLCNTTDGECFECKDGSYKADGDCVMCPDGCAQCTDSHTCTVCNDGFIGIIDDRCLLECPNIYGDNNDPICGTGLCINQPAHWNISRNECQHAMEHLSNCFTEGVCATLESSLFNLERTSHNATKYSLLYRTFKCSLECDEHVTRTLTGPCEGLTCIHKCELQETAYSNTNVYRRNDTPPKTWVNSHCNIVTSTDNTSWPTYRIVLVGIVIVCAIMICILIALISQRTCSRGFTKRNTTKEEDLRFKDFTRPDNRTEAHGLSVTCPGDDQSTEPMLPMDTVLNISVDEGFEGSRQQSRSQSVSTTVSSF